MMMSIQALSLATDIVRCRNEPLGYDAIDIVLLDLGKLLIMHDSIPAMPRHTKIVALLVVEHETRTHRKQPPQHQL